MVISARKVGRAFGVGGGTAAAPGADRAVFVGELAAHAAPGRRPDESPCLDEDEQRARISRRRMLDLVASENSLMLPAH
jgi:hypothetical protein